MRTQIVLGNSSNVSEGLKLWDVRSGQLIRTFKTNFVSSVAFAPDGRFILAGYHSGPSAPSLELWDISTGRIVQTFNGHTAVVNSVAFSIDGKYAVSTSGDELQRSSEDNTVRVWRIADGKLLKTLVGHSDRVTSATFSQDGTRIISGSGDKTVRLWNATTGQLLRIFTGHTGQVTSVSMSPDGALILSGGKGTSVWKESYDNRAIMWDRMTGQQLFSLPGHSSYVNSVGFSPDGAFFSTLSTRPSL